MSRHPDFKTLEATRATFEPAQKQFETTKSPDPEWVPGSGTGSALLPGVAEGLWSGTGGRYKEINPLEVSAPNLYKMLISAITPRPIGFCSTIDASGVTNLAPFSYFSLVGHNPPMISVSFTHPSSTQLKDTCANIKATKTFSMNIISEPFVEAANYSCTDAPVGLSEWALSGLTQVPSKLIKPARVGEAAFSMECDLEMFYDMYDQHDPTKLSGTMVLGRVKLFHVREDIIDENLLIDTAALQPVSRLGGISYGRTTSTYEIPRPVWAHEKERPEVQAALARGETKAEV